jgi:hypothetical protein
MITTLILALILSLTPNRNRNSNPNLNRNLAPYRSPNLHLKPIVKTALVGLALFLYMCPFIVIDQWALPWCLQFQWVIDAPSMELSESGGVRSYSWG